MPPRRRPARAVIAHVDTLGAQVKLLKPNGRLTIVPIGNWSARFAEGARATVFCESGFYRGTILPLKASGHTFNDEVDTLPVGWDYVELRIDALARNQEDLSRLGIDVGDIIAIGLRLICRARGAIAADTRRRRLVLERGAVANRFLDVEIFFDLLAGLMYGA